jgi:hypothetical protein
MEPIREPQSSGADPSVPRDVLSDDAVVAYLRDRAPGLPTEPFDPRAVTIRARSALHRVRRRRLQTALVTGVGAGAAYVVLALVFALTGPVPVPGLGRVSVPGASAIRDAMEDYLPTVPPGPDDWPDDVDRLEAEVRPVAEELKLEYYIPASDMCGGLDYGRGDYGDPACTDGVPFDAQALADFERLTAAVERTDVSVERIMRVGVDLWVQLHDSSIQYNYQYVYLRDGGSPPPKTWPEEEWTRVAGNWWFHRDHDD